MFRLLSLLHCHWHYLLLSRFRNTQKCIFISIKCSITFIWILWGNFKIFIVLVIKIFLIGFIVTTIKINLKNLISPTFEFFWFFSFLRWVPFIWGIMCKLLTNNYIASSWYKCACNTEDLLAFILPTFSLISSTSFWNNLIFRLIFYCICDFVTYINLI